MLVDIPSLTDIRNSSFSPGHIEPMRACKPQMSSLQFPALPSRGQPACRPEQPSQRPISLSWFSEIIGSRQGAVIMLVNTSKLEENAFVGSNWPVSPGEMGGRSVGAGRDLVRTLDSRPSNRPPRDLGDLGNHAGLLYARAQHFDDSLIHGFDDLSRTAHVFDLTRRFCKALPVNESIGLFKLPIRK